MKELVVALVKFQSELKPVIKDSNNPFFKSKYADLSSILEEVMPVLSRNGLALMQTMRIDGENSILQTRIMHISGQEIVSEVYLPFLADAQKMGSQLSYYKRYAIQAALGVATANEDDDGNRATEKYAPPKDTRKIEPVKQAEQFVAKTVAKQSFKLEEEKPKSLTQTAKDDAELVARIQDRLGVLTAGKTKEEKGKFLKDRLGVNSFGEVMNMKNLQLFEALQKLS